MEEEQIELYDVTFHSDTIHTHITFDPSIVDSWISTTLQLHPHALFAGPDVEWRPNTQHNLQNPVATLQLCVGTRCLTFQMLYAPFIPHSLVSFLSNPYHTFVGVGIQQDMQKLGCHLSYNGFSFSIANLSNLCADLQRLLVSNEAA